MARRPSMLATAVREIIAPILRECPHDCGIVSITQVDVSSDFSYATIYISALMKPELALEFLEGKIHDLQRTLSDLPRRKIPMIRFRIDRRGEAASRLDALLEG